MRILYVTQWYAPPAEPGLGRAYEFSRIWASQGHEVTVLASRRDHLAFRNRGAAGSRPSDAWESNGVRVLRVWSGQVGPQGRLQRGVAFGSFFVSGLHAARRISRPDVVLASSPPVTVGILGRLLARHYDVPYVVELRDLWPETILASSALRPGPTASFLARLQERCVREAEAVIVVTRGDRQHLLETNTCTIEPAVITHGVDDWMMARRPHVRPAGKRVKSCLYIGAMGHYNRVGELVDMARRSSDAAGLRFSFVGDGTERSAIAARLRESPCPRITLSGPLSRRSAFDAMMDADVCLLASGTHDQYRSWLPNKGFEYLASGTPVVASAQGELADLLRQAGSTVVPPGNPSALTAALQESVSMSSAERVTTGERGRAFVANRHYRPELAGRLLTVLSHAVSGR